MRGSVVKKGDRWYVKIELDVDPATSKVRQAFFSGDGCCISQASASMLVEQLEGKTIDEVKNFSADDMLKLFGAKLTPNRQKCCLLSWRVVQQAIYSPLGAGDDGDQSADGKVCR